MSAGVSDQRMKGQGNQVTNGPKDHVNEHEDFDTWRAQHHQGYTAPISTTMPSDHYISNYYGTSFPYQTFGVGDGTWSNSGDHMTFLGGYGGQMGPDSYGDGRLRPSQIQEPPSANAVHTTFGMDGIYSAFGQAAAAPAAAGFNYFHGSGDFSTWGNSAAAPRKAHYDEYYRQGDPVYQGVETLKGIEQGMQGLGLSEPNKVENKDNKEVGSSSGGGGSQPKKMTWATIASQPAKPQPQVGSAGVKKKGPGMPPPPMVPGKHNMDIGTWEGKNSGSSSNSGGGGNTKSGVVSGGSGAVSGSGGGAGAAAAAAAAAQAAAQAAVAAVAAGGGVVAGIRPSWSGTGAGTGPLRPTHQPPPYLQPAAPPPPQPAAPHPRHHPAAPVTIVQAPPPVMPPPQMAAPAQQVVQQQQQQPPASIPSHPVLDELRIKNNYNPTDFDISAKGARFFVIKSYSEDDIHRSIKYEIWCSTEHGNKRLDQAYREREMKPNGAVYLFFSVNGSGHFCGMARMVSAVDYNASSSVWSQDKWKGQFRVRWIYVKDVPNVQLRHIKLENNENKPVTNSRDTQEVPFEKGKLVLRVIHSYKHTTSIFDDFVHYERRQEEEDSKKELEAASQSTASGPHQNTHHKDREGGRSGRGGGNRNNNRNN